MPELPEGGYTLVVNASKGSESTSLSQPVKLERRFRVMLSSDKPTYQPGQTIHVRALAREVQIGQPIKPKWFKPVAEILAAVYRLRKGAAA